MASAQSIRHGTLVQDVKKDAYQGAFSDWRKRSVHVLRLFRDAAERFASFVDMDINDSEVAE